MLDVTRPRRSGPALRGPTVPTRAVLDLVLDASILIGFTVAYSVGFTGLVLHEWWGLALALALLVHLALHGDWVVRTTRRLFTRRGRERLVWLVNLVLLTAMTLCIASGVLISVAALPALGLHPAGNEFWRGMHSSTATLTLFLFLFLFLFLVPVHAALRWRWIVSVARRVAAGDRRRLR